MQRLFLSELKKLEKEHELELAMDENLVVNGTEKTLPKKGNEMQMSFFQLSDPLLQQIKDDVLKEKISTVKKRVECIIDMKKMIKKQLHNIIKYQIK